MDKSITKLELALLSGLGFGAPVYDNGFWLSTYGVFHGKPAFVRVAVIRYENDGGLLHVEAWWHGWRANVPNYRFANERAVRDALPSLAVAVRKALKAKCHEVNAKRRAA